MTNPFGANNSVGGLHVENGRLINERADGESGIAAAARIKRSIKHDRKVNEIAEGIELAENKKSFRQIKF